MTFFKYLAFIALILGVLTPSIASAQTDKANEPNPLKNGSIRAQFEYISKKSYSYKSNKVVKENWLSTLKSNTIDTLKVLEQKIDANNEQVLKQQNTITKLEESLANLNKDLQAVTLEKDNMQFVGIPFSKQSYKTLMWAIIGLLVILLIFFILKFRNSNAVTVTSKQALADIEAEFEDHRRRALEREQKVMRKLQDEINKQKKNS